VWAESLIADEQLCDAIAILGSGEHRRPFLGALLANVSKPFRASLYGDFREGKTKELMLVHVVPEAFECILRAAAFLDPNLNTENVLPTLEVAMMYMIEDLVNACTTYARLNLGPENIVRTLEFATTHRMDDLIHACVTYLKEKVQVDHLLAVLSKFARSDVALPEEAERSLWHKILVNSEKVLKSPSFIATHGSIVMRLVQLDEFGVDEEFFWSRLVDWSANAATNPDLLEPTDSLSCTSPVTKRLKIDENATGSCNLARHTAILRSMSSHVRFCAMGKEFFFDKAKTYLTREDSDTIVGFHMLGRLPNGLALPRRCGLDRELQQPFSVTGAHGPEEANKLAVGRGAWKPGVGLTLDLQFPIVVNVTRITLTFSGEGAIWTPSFRINGANACLVATAGTSATRANSWSFHDNVTYASTFVIGASELGTLPGAALERIEIMGRTLPGVCAESVVNKMFTELAVKQES
jgi:hypothetical protein